MRTSTVAAHIADLIHADPEEVETDDLNRVTLTVWQALELLAPHDHKAAHWLAMENEDEDSPHWRGEYRDCPECKELRWNMEH